MADNGSRLYADLKAGLDSLSKAVFSQPNSAALYSRVDIRPLLLKNRRVFQIERFQGGKAFHQNVSGEELLNIFCGELDGRYRQALLTSSEGAVQYVLKRDGGYRRSARAAALPGKDAGHDRAKNYILREGEPIPALVDLGVFTPEYRIVKAKYDKYRQINRFVELIDQEFSKSSKDEITVLDFGCGKSYLTFIMYYYFAVKKGVKAKMIGYDLKEDVVENVTRDELYGEKVDMVVSLHACDTATDYALDFAARRGAEHIFSVPCCQHEINSSIKKGGELDVFLRYGIIKERMSALLTDAIRAMVLEDLGYSVDIIEFTDLERSLKNLMLRARYTGKRSGAGRAAARELAERYGFRQTLLELAEKWTGTAPERLVYPPRRAP